MPESNRPSGVAFSPDVTACGCALSFVHVAVAPRLSWVWLKWSISQASRSWDYGNISNSGDSGITASSLRLPPPPIAARVVVSADVLLLSMVLLSILVPSSSAAVKVTYLLLFAC